MLFKESVAVHRIHEHDSYYCSQSRETPRSFNTFLYDHQKEIGYQGDPNLYLDGVGTLSIEVSNTMPAHSLAFTHYKSEIGSKEYGMDHLDLFNPETYRFVDGLFKEYLEGKSPELCGILH